MENTFHIQWHITDFCNLRCRHCYQENFSPESNLSFEKLEKIFLNIYDFLRSEGKRLVIDITGGEAFLHPQWEKICSLVYNSDITEETGIITNGMPLISNFGKLQKFPEMKMKISAEGLDKASYEFFRGIGNYEKFTAACESLGKSQFETTLMFTLLNENFDQVTGLFGFIKKFGFKKFVIERFIPWGIGSKMKHSVISADKWKKTVNILFDGCGMERDIFSVLAYRGFMIENTGRNFHLYGAPCVVGADGIAVMPDGTVFPCRRFPLSIGNLLTDSLGDIWNNSPVLNKLRNRKFLKGECGKCDIEDCLGCRALAYCLTGDYLASDPLCFLL
jgi:radical SAM protein with 4Fe4S-binding SPASM domain